ncbi:MAG TPA: hypothetical protein VGD88_05540 [Opitutaceae bacterium]
MSAVALRAQWKIPEAEVSAPPSAARLAEVASVVATSGWAAVQTSARDAGLLAYSRDRTDAAEAWLLVADWARFFGENQRTVVNRWIGAVNEAKLGHPNMATEYHPPDAPMSALVRAEFGQWLLANRDFSRSFFDLIEAVDYTPEVIRILDALYAADPRRFARHAQLALAIAVVHDVPPPPTWPHAQVAAAALPRRLMAPRDAFTYWSTADDRGLTLQRLTRLTAGELKFVIDAAAPQGELDWARQSVKGPITRLPGMYDAVRYRMDRLEANVMQWPGRSYTLPAILEEGGICVDQAYFAAHAGKALGVPTLMFRGAGLDGRHAWFGYLDENQRWKLDVGRYADQRYVSGLAFDPQTWGNVSDHELAFLAEGFRRLPAYRQSQVHASVAAELLRAGQGEAALRAARKAVNYERRNLRAWSVLGLALNQTGADARTREATLREGVLAFQRYPDLYAEFMQQVIALLRERGEVSAATNEERLLAQKFQAQRVDLSVKQAAEIVGRAMRTQPLAEQVQAYNRALEQYGPAARVEFFDKIVRPFVEHLVGIGQKDEAKRAVERARTVLEVTAGRQLDRELAELAATVR